MKKTIEITGEDAKEILDNLPKHIQDKIKEKARKIMDDKKPDCGIELLRSFVEKFEENDPIDEACSFACANLIVKIILGVKEFNSRSGRFSGLDLAQIVVDAMRNEISNIESTVLSATKEKLKH